MKIGQKLIGSFAIVAIIGAIIGGVGWYGIGELDRSMVDIATIKLPSVETILKMDATMGDIATAQMEVLNPSVSIENVQGFYEEIDANFTTIRNLQEKFKSYINNDIDAQNFEEIVSLCNKFKDANDKFINISKEMDRTGIRNPTLVKYNITDIEASHRAWIFHLSESVVEGTPFTGQLDPTKCALGEWMANYNLNNEVIRNSFDKLKKHHDKLHTSGKKIKQILAASNSKANKNKAMKYFDDESIPAMDKIIEQLQTVMVPEAEKSYALLDSLAYIEGKFLDPAFDALMNKMGVVVTKINEDAHKSKAEGLAAVSSSKTLIIISIIFGVLVSLGFGFIIARSISKPVNEITKIAEAISTGDIEHNIEIKSKDETGQLAKAFQILIEYMKELAEAANQIASNNLTIDVEPKSDKDILGISFKKMISNLTGIVQQLNITAEQVVSAATEVASSSEQMSRGAKDQTDQVTQISTAVEEMTVTIVESSKNAGEANSAALQAGATAGDGAQIVSETIQGMQEIANVVRESGDSIGKLAQSADQIGEIVGVIDDIADQTNLLALNAAIEAARAGEQGRGFAVVADEVRKLAERTGKATSEITDMIKGIQNETNDAVQSMEKGVKEVDHGRELTDKAGSSLNEIVNMSTQVVDMIQQIATASEEQSSAAEQISKNMENIASIAIETATGAEQSATAAEQLNQNAEGMKQIVGQFKIKETVNS